jgi:hypothetical protein
MVTLLEMGMKILPYHSSGDPLWDKNNAYYGDWDLI